MEDTMEKVKETENLFQELYDRMDSDASLARLASYTLTTSDDKPIPSVVSVTMNEPAVFLNAIVSMLQEAVWQTRVEGNVSAAQSFKIEQFIDETLRRADERLLRMGKPQLFPFLCNHICARGWIGARWITRIEGGKYIPDVLPLDMRYCAYERDENGLTWASYRTVRTAAQVEAEYGYASDSESVNVVDYWDGTHEEVWIDDEELVLSQKHPLDCVPFVIQPAPAGFMFRDDGYIRYEGESIFSLNRNMYKEYNRLVSIDQTLAMESIMPPFEKTVRDDTLDDTPSPYPRGLGLLTEVREGEEYKMVQRPDINMAGKIAHSNIAGALQRGGVNNIDLGNITQPTSAVWITEQTEIRNKLMAPRLSALGMFYEQLGRMIVHQFKIGGHSGSVDIARFGKKMQYKASDLGDLDEYDIRCQLMSKSKKQEIANISVAAAARGVMSRETIVKDVLCHQDAEGELARLDNEAAEEIMPALKLFRMALAACDAAEKAKDKDEKDAHLLESIMLTDQATTMVKMQRAQQKQVEQQAQGTVSPPGAQGTREQANAPLPLMPQTNTPKKGNENGRNWGRTRGGQPPKVPVSNQQEGQ